MGYVFVHSVCREFYVVGQVKEVCLCVFDWVVLTCWLVVERAVDVGE